MYSSRASGYESDWEGVVNGGGCSGSNSNEMVTVIVEWVTVAVSGNASSVAYE